MLVDVAGDGSLTVAGRAVADLPASGSIDCQRTDLPYESSDPAENLDEAARLTWANRSDRDVRLGLTVHDDDPGADLQLVVESDGSLSVASDSLASLPPDGQPSPVRRSSSAK